MSRDAMIEKAMKTLSMLPEDKLEEVVDFADYILKKYEEQYLQKGIEKMVSESDAFQFLAEEDEELYNKENFSFVK
jgi:hypothetical protein